jgi:hypothetical protein
MEVEPMRMKRSGGGAGIIGMLDYNRKTAVD